MAKKESIGARLKKLMLARNITQTALAQRSGIDRSDLNRIVNERRDPRYDELVWICEVLQTPLDEVLSKVELPESLREAIAKIEAAAQRVLAAESERDEIAAKLAATEKAFEAERADHFAVLAARQAEIDQLHAELADARKAAEEPERKRAVLEGQIEQFVAERDVARKAAEEASRQRASMELALRTDQANWKVERGQLMTANQQKDAAIQHLRVGNQQKDASIEQLRMQVTDLQKVVMDQKGTTVAVGLLGSLAGIFGGALLGAATANEEPEFLREARARARRAPPRQ